MSHSHGYALFSDGLKLYFEYDGTSDVCWPRLRSGINAVDLHWRKPEQASCSCFRDEPVKLWSGYGGDGGFHWHGRACRHCMAITNGLRPYETEDIQDGEPPEAPFKEKFSD